MCVRSRNIYCEGGVDGAWEKGDCGTPGGGGGLGSGFRGWSGRFVRVVGTNMYVCVSPLGNLADFCGAFIRRVSRKQAVFGCNTDKRETQGMMRDMAITIWGWSGVGPGCVHRPLVRLYREKRD